MRFLRDFDTREKYTQFCFPPFDWQALETPDINGVSEKILVTEGPFRVRSGSVRGPFGIRSGSIRDPFGLRSAQFLTQIFGAKS